MKGKVDTTQLTVLRFLFCVGDKNLPPHVLPKLGPLGLKPKEIHAQVDKECKAWAGVRIFVELHAQNRACKIVYKIGTSAHIIKEMGGVTGERDRKKVKLPPRSGNISFDQLLKVARICEAEGKSNAKGFEGTVKTVLGTCMTMGCTVDGQSPKEVRNKINAGELVCSK